MFVYIASREGFSLKAILRIACVAALLACGGCVTSASALYDPATNTSCALAILNEKGMRAWYGYRQHAGECDDYEIDQPARPTRDRSGAPDARADGVDGGTSSNDDAAPAA